MKRLLPFVCVIFTACDSEVERAGAPTPAPNSAPMAKAAAAPTPVPWRPLHATQLSPPGNPFSKEARPTPAPTSPKRR